MSKPVTLLFSLTLRHLAADAKKAGAELPNKQLHYVSVPQLETLLRSLEGLAPTVTFPAEPEIRIKGPTGEFVVRASGGKLNLVSWSKAHKGGVTTVEKIIAAVADETAGEESRHVAQSGEGSSGRSWREKLSLVGLAAAILAVNGFTIWFLQRPPRSLVADYRPVAPEQAQRVVSEVAGVYETGKKPGDRRLEIAPPSAGRRIKFGVGGAAKETQTFDVKPVEAGGGMALLTSKKSLIKIKDSVSVVLYGDTYTRVTN